MRTKPLFVASTLLSAVAAAPVGCGSLDGHTGTPGTLATVQGALSDPSGYAVRNDVRVAVVWLNTNGSGYSVSQDLPVQPVFPASFVVQLDGPPPAGALGVPKGLDEPIAVGVVVAYEDLNGNGKLDLVPSNAVSFIDRIVGANQNLYLFYIDGPVPLKGTESFVGTATRGYNLVQTMTCTTPGGYGGGGGGSSSGGMGSGFGSSTGSSSGGPVGMSGSGSGSAGNEDAGAPAGGGVMVDEGGTGCIPLPPEWLPMTTPYDLTVSSDPKVNQIMCQNGGSANQPSSGTGGGTGWNVGTQGTPPGGYPSRTDLGLTCNGSTSYDYLQCMMVQQGVCGPSMTNCTSIYVELGSASPPPGWPCP
jgi:hypothetical protein